MDTRHKKLLGHSRSSDADARGEHAYPPDEDAAEADGTPTVHAAEDAGSETTRERAPQNDQTRKK